MTIDSVYPSLEGSQPFRPFITAEVRDEIYTELNIEKNEYGICHHHFMVFSLWRSYGTSNEWASSTGRKSI